MISGVVILFDIQKMSLSNIIRGGGSRGVNPAAVCPMRNEFCR